MPSTAILAAQVEDRIRDVVKTVEKTNELWRLQQAWDEVQAIYRAARENIEISGYHVSQLPEVWWRIEPSRWESAVHAMGPNRSTLLRTVTYDCDECEAWLERRQMPDGLSRKMLDWLLVQWGDWTEFFAAVDVGRMPLAPPDMRLPWSDIELAAARAEEAPRRAALPPAPPVTDDGLEPDVVNIDDFLEFG